ncbi:prohead protease/major capsid protein fusion protein [Paenirhodobacter enshiensis]|uniref:Peptidase U35 n=1 Tax=Paenirhodobacter enshiensis TaxID=1105367 RepID=A0A086Y1L3_9RHOB|nr:prohead protease/major capsid protein fusion protein [Paenirhodobacter enshiensis]KFI28163.1 peptidase U35 [Paenirhodobacter enshiensis]
MSLHLRAATPAASTVDLEARTVEAIVSTGAEVARPGYIERLDLTGADLSRLRAGAPVLDGHRSATTSDQLGVVEAAELRPEGLWVLMRFRSTDPAKAVLNDIADGTLRGLSIGYSVTEWKDQQRGKDRQRTAVNWTPIEVSVVPVPADAGAHFRKGNTTMPETQEQTLTTRAEINGAIRSIAETASLGRDWADAQIDAETTVEAARAAAFEAMQHRSQAQAVRTPTATIGTDHTDPAVIATRAGEALFARSHPEHQLSPEARQFAHMSVTDMARASLERAGLSTRGLSNDTILTRALGMHTTGDFSAILDNTANREVRRGYEAAPSGVRQLARQSTARDFRAKSSVAMGDFGTLSKVNEAGEFTYGTIGAAPESYKLDTYGKIFAISRQAMVNDDLGAFTAIPNKLGAAAADFEANVLFDCVNKNPVMADGKTVFHADHGNLAEVADPPEALSLTTIAARRLAMRKQTSPGGVLINATPRFLMVGPELETEAEQLLTQINATKTADVNPFSNLSLIVEPRLTGLEWYLAADPAVIDGLEYAYLEGAPGPQVETRTGFEVDGVEFKIRLDFGAGWLDFRGWQKDLGA